MRAETPAVLLENALLPGGWRRRVRVEMDPAGDILEVVPDCEREDVALLAGHALPGMVNLHSHAHQRAMVGLAERSARGEDNFWSWRERMYHFVERLRPEDLEAIAAMLYVEMLEAGYTSVAEFQYLHHGRDGTPYDNPAEMSLRILSAAAEAGIGITSLPVLYRYGGFGSQAPGDAQRRFVNDARPFLDIVASLERAAAGNPDVATGIAPHSPRAVDEALLAEVLSEFAPGRDGPLHLHIAEQTQEVEDCVAWCGRRPVEWLLDEFEVDAGWCLIHATHTLPEELTRVARSGAVVGLCPTTEANLGDGLFDALSYMHERGRLGIGSDSQISVSPVEELRWLEYGQRLQHRRRNVLNTQPGSSTGRALYEQALAGGAQAVGRRVGELSPGCRGDIVIVDGDDALTAGREHDSLLDTWLFASNRPLVKQVLVGGRVVVEAGQHVRSHAISARFKSVMQALLA